MSSRATPSKALSNEPPRVFVALVAEKPPPRGALMAGGRERGEYGEEPRTGREGERPRAPPLQQNP